MTEGKSKETADKPKAAAKKAAPKASGKFLVAEGRSVSIGSRFLDAGAEIKVDEVSDIEALIKGGFVVKA